MNKKVTAALAFTMSIAMLLGYMAANFNQQISVETPVKWQANVKVQVFRNGAVVYEYETHNILLTIGSTWIKDFLKSGTAGATNATDDIAVGNHTTPAIGDTKLVQECTTAGLTRQSGTVTNLNATAYQVEYQWTATGTVTVNATSLHHDPTPDTANNAVAIALIQQASLIADDQVKITWTVNVPPG